MSGFFSTLASALTPSARVSPSTWEPSSPLPSGSTAIRETFKLPISSRSPVTFTSTGSWSHGTVVFAVRESAAPPSYDLAVSALTAQDSKARGPQLGEGEGWLEVEMEARWNDEGLWNEADVGLRKVGQAGLELRVEVCAPSPLGLALVEADDRTQTPTISPGRLTSQLSFHITFFFPPSLPHLVSLHTSGAHWRTLGSPTLSTIFFNTLSISTSNALISFSFLRAGTVDLATANATISGSYTAEQLKATTANGAISGTYLVENRCEVRTNNAGVSGEYDVGVLVIWTRNATVDGVFTARDGIVVENANGAVGGTFSCPGGIVVRSANAAIKGLFRAGKELRLKTQNASIDVTVELLGEGGREGTPELLDSKKGLVASGRVELVAESSNARINVSVEEHPRGVMLDAKVRSSNSPVKLQDQSPFVGSFKVCFLRRTQPCVLLTILLSRAGIDLERTSSV